MAASCVSVRVCARGRQLDNSFIATKHEWTTSVVASGIQQPNTYALNPAHLSHRQKR